MPLVDPARGAQGEMLHDAGQGHLGHLEGHLEVIGQATQGMEAMPRALDALCQQSGERLVVLRIKEERVASVAPEHDMGDRARVVKTRFASHERIGAARWQNSKPDPIVLRRCHGK